MCGYIKKSKVLDIINKGQDQLKEKEYEIVLTGEKPKNDIETRDFLEAINKLKGGYYFLETIKKHFK